MATTVVIDPLLRLKQVLTVFPVSRSMWYQGVKDGVYPKGVKIGPKAVAWRSSEIKALIDASPRTDELDD